MAGPRNTAPVHTLNCAPCNGHVTVVPSSEPSDNGPRLCVHIAWVAQKPPSMLNTAQSTDQQHRSRRPFVDTEFVLLEL